MHASIYFIWLLQWFVTVAIYQKYMPVYPLTKDYRNVFLSIEPCRMPVNNDWGLKLRTFQYTDLDNMN